MTCSTGITVWLQLISNVIKIMVKLTFMNECSEGPSIARCEMRNGTPQWNNAAMEFTVNER